MSIANKIDTYK